MPEQHGSPRPTDAETALRQQTQVLGERIKELQCLYAIAALVAKPHITLEALCQGIMQVMPPAWQYPDIAWGRIVLGNRTFTTHNFQPTRWQLSSAIQVDGECVGSGQYTTSKKDPTAMLDPFCTRSNTYSMPLPGSWEKPSSADAARTNVPATPRNSRPCPSGYWMCKRRNAAPSRVASGATCAQWRSVSHR